MEGFIGDSVFFTQTHAVKLPVQVSDGGAVSFAQCGNQTENQKQRPNISEPFHKATSAGGFFKKNVTEEWH
ncbi:hypothetical protein C5470_11305 [Photorhabdus stackebrandtii]|uniref:Uncharacterized protein n=1 Tax=Photorhabdus stackebrandtii TaxID=1123042 RepID=A0A7X5QMC4_9GAMM|nr:hypothetical protein [Photorhabdus stackebrandtii]